MAFTTYRGQRVPLSLASEPGCAPAGLETEYLHPRRRPHPEG